MHRLEQEVSRDILPILKYMTVHKFIRYIDVYRQLAGKLDFENDGMKIVSPDTPDDIASEGNSLHHCAGSYTERVANGQCIILFLRQCSDESKPFYTIEVRGQKAVQVRGWGTVT